MVEFTPDKFYTSITQSQGSKNNMTNVKGIDRCRCGDTHQTFQSAIVHRRINYLLESTVLPANTKSASELYYKATFLFLNLNLFPSVPPAINEHQLRNQRISTRLFISLLIISLSILLLYTSLINITETVNVKAPSIIKYEELYNSYSETLTCECTQISINYEKFIQIQYTLHQVCHSDFVTQTWFNYLATSPGHGTSFYDTFRLTGTFTFQALYTLCVLVDETILNRLSQFYSSQYVSAYVTPSNVFQLQTKSFISQFISSTTNEFLLSLAMIRKTTQSNALLSAQFTNYRFYHNENDNNLVTESSWDGDCMCSSSATCISQYAVINYPSFTKVFPLPGLYTGCYIIESLLQSSLQCFYDQACIDNLLLYLGSSTIINVTALDISLSTLFLENSTITDILDQLMVEEWNSSSIYEDYYSECQPSGCSYTVTSKNSVIYIVTTLIGLVGGLITVMKLMVPILVNFVRKCIHKEVKTEAVCHSDLVTQQWINYLATSSGSSGLPYEDFRVTSTFTFQAMSAFCTLVNQTISNSLIQFYSNQYVSASVTPANVFQLQTKAFISQFKSATATGFLLSLAMIRNTTQSNALLSGELNNFGISLPNDYSFFTDSRSYGHCTCSSSSTCITQSPIYNLLNNTLLFSIPGFYTGCYIIESLLQSSLQCFYNQTCINQLQSYFQVSSIMNVTALDILLSIQFLENSTIADILDQLMVEEWNSSSIYENYYSECQPSYCSYTVTSKNSVIYIATTLIGLVGGLIAVLKFIVPYLV
ncbi:unnamed protein product, partial [Adineta steineri]